ncbi:dihydroneopterin aldolase [Yunchengibacter salinarum]|uniref:dihydroneopterin aldolase n=1 Tax=Yunchengibacter salinarum TaxID=3133399 RepID=UPI0035B67398
MADDRPTAPQLDPVETGDAVVPFADAARGVRRVFVRNLLRQARIGVFAHEQERVQTVRITVDLSVREDRVHHRDNLENVLCYKDVVERIDAILEGGHINLVESMAERIAESELADGRVLSARVMVEKLEAIDGADSVGVEIERHRPA